jgi:hypothetical protein
MEVDQVWMGQVTHDPELALQRQHRLRAQAMEGLERHSDAALAVEGLPDRPHPPRSESLSDLEPSGPWNR